MTATLYRLPADGLLQHQVLYRLFWLRWATIAGELLVMAAAHFWLEIHLSLGILLFVIAVQAGLNLATGWRMRWSRPAGYAELFLQLLLDIALLSVMLFFSGGATNPFVSFYLPTLAAGAAMLAWPYAFALAGCALAAYSVLVYVYEPLHIHDASQAMAYHLAGMWVNFSISALLITWFVTRIAAVVRARDGLLAQAREQQLQSHRILALGTQAASAAHALNTPLSTVAVVTGELLRDARATPALQAYEEDLRIVEEQISLCKQALESMRLDADAQRDEAEAVNVRGWLVALLDGWRLRHPAVQLEATLQQGVGSSSQVNELTQIVLTLLDNAAYAAGTLGMAGRVKLSLTTEPDTGMASIRIEDNGPGIAADFLARLGYGPVPSSFGGNGIGLMLAFASAGQLGGRLALTSEPGRGVQAGLTFPIQVADSLPPKKDLAP